MSRGKAVSGRYLVLIVWMCEYARVKEQQWIRGVTLCYAVIQMLVFLWIIVFMLCRSLSSHSSYLETSVSLDICHFILFLGGSIFSVLKSVLLSYHVVKTCLSIKNSTQHLIFLRHFVTAREVLLIITLGNNTCNHWNLQTMMPLRPSVSFYICQVWRLKVMGAGFSFISCLSRVFTFHLFYHLLV